MIDARTQRFAEAYLEMAKAAKYRPQAPSDGCGHILLSREQMRDQARLDREAVDYAIRFAAEEDELCFTLGCSNFPTNRAFVWTVEAARQLASGNAGNETALRLLEMVTREVRRVQRAEVGRQ